LLKSTFAGLGEKGSVLQSGSLLSQCGKSLTLYQEKGLGKLKNLTGRPLLSCVLIWNGGEGSILYELGRYLISIYVKKNRQNLRRHGLRDRKRKRSAVPYERSSCQGGRGLHRSDDT